MTLTCPAGEVISKINYASYGMPTGSCGNYVDQAWCDSSTSESVVTSLCVGKSSCSFTANNQTFGDPCNGTVKHMYAEAACVPEPDPCANYGGTVVNVNSNIKVCNQSLTWGTWDNSKIPNGWQVCTTAQWTAYAPSASPSAFGLATLWINNSACGNGSHREVYQSYPMNQWGCYGDNGTDCCWPDSTQLRFAICKP